MEINFKNKSSPINKFSYKRSEHYFGIKKSFQTLFGKVSLIWSKTDVCSVKFMCKIWMRNMRIIKQFFSNWSEKRTEFISYEVGTHTCSIKGPACIVLREKPSIHLKKIPSVLAQIWIWAIFVGKIHFIWFLDMEIISKTLNMTIQNERLRWNNRFWTRVLFLIRKLGDLTLLVVIFYDELSSWIIYVDHLTCFFDGKFIQLDQFNQSDSRLSHYICTSCLTLDWVLLGLDSNDFICLILW